MFSRKIIALLVTLLGAGLFSQAAAQVRGLGGAGRAGGFGGSARGYGRAHFVRSAHRHYYAGFGYYPFDDFYYEPPETEPVPVPLMVAPPEPLAPPSKPAEALVLENRDGQWVRISTAHQLPVGSEGGGRAAESTSGLRDKAEVPSKLPPPVLVFRDGHSEEVQRYVVQGDTLYASADYWTTGSWTRKIPVADLDIQASVKLNEARGGKFTLPARPNEVVVRF